MPHKGKKETEIEIKKPKKVAFHPINIFLEKDIKTLMEERNKKIHQISDETNTAVEKIKVYNILDDNTKYIHRFPFAKEFIDTIKKIAKDPTFSIEDPKKFKEKMVSGFIQYLDLLIYERTRNYYYNVELADKIYSFKLAFAKRFIKTISHYLPEIKFKRPLYISLKKYNNLKRDIAQAKSRFRSKKFNEIENILKKTGHLLPTDLYGLQKPKHILHNYYFLKYIYDLPENSNTIPQILPKHPETLLLYLTKAESQLPKYLEDEAKYFREKKVPENIIELTKKYREEEFNIYKKAIYKALNIENKK